MDQDQVVVCPHCQANVSIPASLYGQVVACPTCQGTITVAAPLRQVAEPLQGTLRTVSGKQYEFDSVLLFDLADVHNANTIRLNAEKNLAGFSSGIGFYGPSLVSVMAPLVLQGVENLISAGMSAHGIQLLEDYYHASSQVRANGRFIPLNQIENIGVPMPDLWRSLERNAFGEVTGGFVSNSDPFVVIRGQATACILWDKVEEYTVAERGHPNP